MLQRLVDGEILATINWNMATRVEHCLRHDGWPQGRAGQGGGQGFGDWDTGLGQSAGGESCSPLAWWV